MGPVGHGGADEVPDGAALLDLLPDAAYLLRPVEGPSGQLGAQTLYRNGAARRLADRGWISGAHGEAAPPYGPFDARVLDAVASAAGGSDPMRIRADRDDGTRSRFDVWVAKAPSAVLVVARDVLDDQMRQSQSDTSLELQRRLAENAADAVFRADRDGAIVLWCSEGIHDLLGWTADQLALRPLSALVHQEDSPRWRLACRSCSVRRQERVQVRLRSRLGEWRWCEVRVRPAGPGDGDELLGAIHDVHHQVLAVEELRRRASTDALTGLLSRGEGLARLERRLSPDLRTGTELAIAYIDLDGLKAANDTFGHAMGDEILFVTGFRIRACVRAGDLVVRLGGDELLVVLQGVRDAADALALAEQIRAACALPVAVEEMSASTTVSIGLTLARPAEDVDTVVKRADRAMYLAKGQGGDSVSFLA
jgi:diguanylate cyclase (GGDEF)-like protein/PAS domain S-box-containing protein